jgi:hypothetical protein
MYQLQQCLDLIGAMRSNKDGNYFLLAEDLIEEVMATAIDVAMATGFSSISTSDGIGFKLNSDDVFNALL